MDIIHCFDDIFIKVLIPNDVTHKYVDWINNKETNKFLVTQKININDCRQYVKNKYNDKQYHFYGIYKNKEHIGNIKLDMVDNELKCGCLGILIGDNKYRNKGYGSKIISFFSKYVHEQFNIKIIILGVLSRHIGAIKCYKKCNFLEISNLNDTLLKIINKYLSKYKFSKDNNDSIYMVLEQ